MKYSTSMQIVPAGAHELVVRPSAGGRIVSIMSLAAGLASFGWAFGLVPPVWPGFDFVATWALYVFGGFFTIVGLVAWERQRIALDHYDRVIRLRRPVKGVGRETRFKDVQAVELVLSSQAQLAGKIDLVLSGPADARIPVAMRRAERDLQADAAALAEFIGVPVRDGRIAAVPSPSGGGQMSVSMRLDRASGTANFRTHKVIASVPGILEVRGTLGSVLFRLIFLAFGIGALLAAAGLLASLLTVRTPLWPRLVALAITLIVGGSFTIVAVKLLGTPAVRLDRVSGEIRGRLKIGKQKLQSLPVKRVVAVQIASGQVDGGDSPSYTAYQLSLVLSDPPGQRLVLMAHAGEKHIRRDAQQIAEFLSVPLLDHT